MSSTAHMISGVLLLIVITVMFGGFSLLWLLPRDRPDRPDFWRRNRRCDAGGTARSGRTSTNRCGALSRRPIEWQSVDVRGGA
jgi:hypothetical protein